MSDGPQVLRYAAFTTDPATGNPAGVVLDATGLDEATMRRIAAEVGYSETAFLIPQAGTGARFWVRYFSPKAEVPFCGHATIAAAVALAEREGPGRVSLETAGGEVVVESRLGPGGLPSASLTSVSPRVDAVDAADLREALAALDWPETDLEPAMPPRLAYAGVWHLVVAAASRERLATLDYDFGRLGRLMAARGWTTVHLVWRAAADTFHVRDPFPPGGVVEDPATGAAAAAFGGYLRALGHIRPPARLTLHQGEDMGRHSLITVDVPDAEGPVRVSGSAVAIPGPRSAQQPG